MRLLAPLAALALLAPAGAAQLTDLQPGRNYPTAETKFGGAYTESIDVGDVDNDGDYDVGVANGGDSFPAVNRLYINRGGLQGGTVGTFSDQTDTRFAGLPADTSRDLDFVDLEGDGDLDVCIANRGTSANGGEVTRAYTNLGGLQQGLTGFFTESTDAFWGDLVGVPQSAEVGAPFGQGPWRAYSCDCEFGDMDDDGDVDLFHSAYGPGINGTHDSRIFLNDGMGRFDELWPWVDPGADTRLHTLDIDLFDFDDDFDLDVFASSRDSQPRTYRNNTLGGTGAGALFTDTTQAALIATGAAISGSSNYECEFGDLDGDGDFDVWAMNYNGFKDVVLANNGDGTFEWKGGWIRADPNSDENEIDFLDFDSDGDLDVFSANFSGTNWLWQNGAVQGLDPDADGLLHRTNSPQGQAQWPETPSTSNGGQSRDADCADMDNDGDPDILIANDANQANRYWVNELGVPDTHAPVLHRITTVADKSDGSDTPIHVALRDNAPYQVTAFYDVELRYAVDGGLEVCVPMTAQGGAQFRGVIPAAVSGHVVWSVRATDDNGNTAVSGTFDYQQTSSASSTWVTVGCGTAGERGVPHLTGKGELVAGQLVPLGLTDAPSQTLAALTLSSSSMPAPFVGGLLHTNPVLASQLASTDVGGALWVELLWPPGLPGGTQTWWQFIVADPASPYGLTLSSALRSTTP